MTQNSSDDTNSDHQVKPERPVDGGDHSFIEVKEQLLRKSRMIDKNGLQIANDWQKWAENREWMPKIAQKGAVLA